MAWPMPTADQWGPAMGVTPDMNMASCTPEQWAVMQQNWQQWAQWQQQYASWQSQYGSKYAEQMQVLQSMDTMPPLPPASAAPPPAPPPPDNPPPLPHENNQPLYGHSHQQSVPVMTTGQTIAPPNNTTDNPTGNNQNRTYPTDTHSDMSQASINTEALKTLTEEEKAFDIQFQKWEEEIDKWKKANINHPDRKAYEEYEEKFKACRARLLERRQQLKQKRAKLLDGTQQTTNSAPRPNSTPRPNSAPRPNIPTAVPPPLPNVITNNSTTSNEQGSNNFIPQNVGKNFSQNTQYNNISQQNYHRDNNKNRYEPYPNSNTNTFTNNPASLTSFLPTSDQSKGIPGLDLVLEADKMPNKLYEVIDITEEPKEKQLQTVQQEPDYSKISKGINNILGDEKIMNILSMVRDQCYPPPPNNNQGSYGAAVGNNQPGNYWDRSESYKDNYGMDQSSPYIKQHNDYSMPQENNQLSKYSQPPPRIFDNRSDNPPPNQYYERNQQQPQTILPRGGMQYNVQPKMPMRSLLEPIQHQNDYTTGGFDRGGTQAELHHAPSQNIKQSVSVRPTPPARPVWVEEPLITPSIIVEYEHKPLRLKARDFIDPVHTFDYNHQSKDSDIKKKNFEKEADNLFAKNLRVSEKEDRFSSDKFSRDLYYRDQERISNREHFRDSRDEHLSRVPRDEYDDRRRYDSDIRDRRYEDRRRDDRDKFSRREDIYRDNRDRGKVEREELYRDRDRDIERNRDRDRERDFERNKDRDKDLALPRERDMYRDRHRDYRRSRSRDKDNRKRGHSKDSDMNVFSNSKKPKDVPVPAIIQQSEKTKHTIMIDDILELPGRQMRPEKIVIILRGPPGSGKSYLAKLIRDREAEQGGTVRVMSIDDYFMQEGEIEEKDPITGKIVKKPSLKYEYDENTEDSYLFSLKRAFKRSITDGYFTFLIFDAVNDQLKSYADIWNYARQYGFQVYICTMDLDSQACFKRNIHNRTLEDIEVICSRFFPTPDHHIQLDPTTLLQSASIPEVHMEDADDDVTMEDAQETEVNNSFTSKWEKMDDAAQLARLDGTSKPLRPSQLTMDDYLQLDDWKPNTSTPGKKTVRWADIEERRQQEKMRAIGFVVGQTDWSRMTDPTMGSRALTQTKYIERVRRT